jgi:hypothetical protein
VQAGIRFTAPLSTASRKKYCQFTTVDDCARL